MAGSVSGNDNKSQSYPRGCKSPNDIEGDALPPEKPDLTLPIPMLSFDEANDWLTGGHAFLVDVREKIQILNYGRIKSSVRIPVYQIIASFSLEEKEFFWKFCAHKPAFHTPIVVYCQAGMLAPIGAEKLRRLGYLEVGILSGGFKTWITNGGDIIPCPERNFHFSGFY